MRRKGERKEQKNIKEIMAENLTKFREKQYLHIQEAQLISGSINQKIHRQIDHSKNAESQRQRENLESGKRKTNLFIRIAL